MSNEIINEKVGSTNYNEYMLLTEDKEINSILDNRSPVFEMYKYRDKLLNKGVGQNVSVSELGKLLKNNEDNELKIQLQNLFLDYINNNETIILDAGSTTYELAKLLKDKMNLTVVTNSLEIAYTLAPSKGVTVNLTGGTADKAFYALYGPLACATIDKIFVDKVVLGTSGLDIFKGITDPNLPVAQMKQAMINVAKEVIIVTDSSKIGKVYFAAVAPLSVVRMIITDSDASENSVRYLREEGIEVVIC